MFDLFMTIKKAMRIHQILEMSNANGPGLRFVIWVQGCYRKCRGCFNSETHDPYGGYELEVSKIIEQIPLAKVSGITISGGEPFEQAEELLALLKKAGRIGLTRHTPGIHMKNYWLWKILHTESAWQK
jgi:anaerobic ribonucleoside-triphosphate reductase activating protein